MRSFILVVMASSLMACSQQAMYSQFQQNNRLECQKETIPNLYQECMERSQLSYEEYQRQRRQLLESGNKNSQNSAR